MLKNLVQQYEGRISQSKRFQSTGKKLVNALIGGSNALPVAAKPLQPNSKALGQSQMVPKPALKRSSAILRPASSSMKATAAAILPGDMPDQLFQVRRDSADTINSTMTNTDSAIEMSDKLPEEQALEGVETIPEQAELVPEQVERVPEQTLAQLEQVLEVSMQVEPEPEQAPDPESQQASPQPSLQESPQVSLQESQPPSNQASIEQASEHAEQVRIPTRRDSAFIPVTVSDDTARGVEIMRAKSMRRMSVAAKQRRVSVLMKPAPFPQQHQTSNHSTISDDFASAILSATDTIFVENKMKGIQKFKRSMSTDEAHFTPQLHHPQQGVMRSISVGKPVKKPLPPMPEKQLPPISNPDNTASMFDATAELNRIRIDQILIQVELRDRLKLLRKSIDSLNSRHDTMSARLCATSAFV
ncbi:hypothetical protein HDU81_004067 [Chytriomyces hyalinus]|nr:hypothetical protein HDU81_004067 [Chytriomyces hyalinus]